MQDKKYYVYLMTNPGNTVIYAGVTSNLMKRVYEHKNKLVQGFTAKYQVTKLVNFEEYGDAYQAISREKQIKAGSRQKKLNLVNSMNSDWNDLASVSLRGAKRRSNLI